jgi:hypothetical protein
MKIWVTIPSAAALYSRGMQFVNVWFYKPKFFFHLMREEDYPFSDNVRLFGLRRRGWQVTVPGQIQQEISAGDLFGYMDRGAEQDVIVRFIWDAIEKHFNNTHPKEWEELERTGKCKQEDFLLEIQLKIEMAPIRKCTSCGGEVDHYSVEQTECYGCQYGNAD